MKIAILGATSQIAKGLITYIQISLDCDLFLYARNVEGVNCFLDMSKVKCDRISVHHIDLFGKEYVDVVVNCVGMGTPDKLAASKWEIFNLTEEFDGIILKYIQLNSNVKYINFSSGAVYGTSFPESVNEHSVAVIPINSVTDVDFYRIAKINSEAKHRAACGNIIDLRVFNYFCRFMDLSSKYFMTELIKSVIEQKVFVTNCQNMTRDYIHPEDLTSLVVRCCVSDDINNVFDVYSRSPVTKSEILDYFSKQYDLKIEYINNSESLSATGSKNIYYSENHNAKFIGYDPHFTSLETIIAESQAVLRKY